MAKGVIFDFENQNTILGNLSLGLTPQTVDFFGQRVAHFQ
jgi:hypothetical protein